MTVSLKATLGTTSCDAINKYQQVTKQVSEGLGTRLPSQVFKGHLCKTPLKLSPKFLLDASLSAAILNCPLRDVNGGYSFQRPCAQLLEACTPCHTVQTLWAACQQEEHRAHRPPAGARAFRSDGGHIWPSRRFKTSGRRGWLCGGDR